ncbi:MAG TPA: DUF4258 domain-containing protein [Thermoanaerobaculia bacterium]
MPEFQLSKHARDMLKERNLREEWVWRTINTPDSKRRDAHDDNMHYTKAIKEREGLVLHVVVSQNTQPYRIVTVFFDRRLGKRS